jgi:rod shape determining protein RodA
MDWLLLLVFVSLTFFGGICIRSAELNRPVTDWWQHWVFGGIGLIATLILARLPYTGLIKWHWITYALTNGLLVAVMIAGRSALGAQRWISIGGFNFQPSEFAKVGMIITLAAILQRRTANTLPAFIRALAITAPTWLLVFVQPDLGTSLVFGAICLAMLYWANANPGWLFLLASPVVSAILFNDPFYPIWGVWTIAMAIVAWFTLPLRWWMAPISIGLNWGFGELGHVFWHILKDYQKARITTFLNPEGDPLGAGYHLIQSRIAIGAGELWGQGLNQGTQTQLNFIPEQHTDFVFSVVGEELGFVGGIFLLLSYLFLCWRLVKVALEAPNNFGSLLAIGVLGMIAFQTIVNISMTLGLAPVTGIPLPLITYGRSSLLTNYLALGLVESVANYRRRFSL